MTTIFVSDFVDIFMVIYNAGAAFILIFMIGQILFMMRKVDKDLLKARIFLNDEILHKTWIYISIAGASFALNNVIKFVIMFTPRGEFLSAYKMPEFTQIVFIVAFILAAYNWYGFIGSFVNTKKRGT
ncbi:MAG: hypothetical protein O8C61_10830 [Candidatus Methanoperedens sp.]|nr:hypothetical protein [Candidatus Methanoperedens sp.]